MASRPRIAVVALGGIFPGAPGGLDEFFRMILERRNAAREVDRGRWLLDPERVYDPRKAIPDRVYSRRACPLEGFEFDPSGFDVAPELLARLDPSCHLLLHAGREAWRAAITEPIDRRRVGVVVGHIALPTDAVSAQAWEIMGPMLLKSGSTPPGAVSRPQDRFVAGWPAAVLARALKLGGGAVALDAACSSSLYAVWIAAGELACGRADAMLTGGVSRPDSLYTQMGFAQLNALSASGIPRPFDQAGDGLVVGEGAGVLMLKRLDDALAQGDRILATIEGIGLSNDIDGSLLAPSSEGQLRAMRAAYAQAGWTPSDIDLVECHATGTPVGDGVEVSSLTTLWANEKFTPGQCAVGSVKSNIGHLLTGAGAAGLTKVILAMRAGVLPPSAGFEKPAPNVKLEGTPFRVQTEQAPWKRRGPLCPRRAAVSAFGFGGINAHVLVQEWLEEAEVRTPRRGREAPGEVPPPEPVAIVGMSVHAGSITSLDEFREKVLAGTAAVSAPPSEGRWWKRPGPPGRYAGALEVGVGEFRIPPKELSEALPQQVLMLQVAKAALEDAHAPRIGSADSAEAAALLARACERTGVFVGLNLDPNTTNFHLRWALLDHGLGDRAGPPLSANRTMGALASIAASRIAREFRFGGPSFALSSEESSGLKALEVGVRALQRGAIDRALVGAVDLAGDMRAVLATGPARPFSASGQARPFEPDADGPAIGEGAAALVLKRLDDALADGDRVYAVIRGIAGTTGGGVDRPVPEAEAYGRALEEALGQAGVRAQELGYIELHGSGAPSEDRLEALALARVVREAVARPGAEPASTGSSVPTRWCALGSAKTVSGHTGAAAGLVSCVKTALCLYQEILPRSTCPARVIPELAALDSGTNGHTPGIVDHSAESTRKALRFHFPRAPQYWITDRELGPRRAAVLDVGQEGNRVAAVLESPEKLGPAAVIEPERRRPLGDPPEGLFVVEGATVPSLDKALKALVDWVGKEPPASIDRMARRWFALHPPQKRPLAVTLVARDAADLVAQVTEADTFLRHSNDRSPWAARFTFSPKPLGPTSQVAFVFPGAGNQHPGMGLGLGCWWPGILRKHHEASQRLAGQMIPDRVIPLRLDWPDDWVEKAEKVLANSPWSVIMGQVTYGIAVSDLIQSFGITPSAVIGYSLGESTALFATGAWRDRDEMLRRMETTDLFTTQLAGPCEAARRAWKLPDDKPVEWAVGVIDRRAVEVRRALEGLDRAYLLIAKTPQECIVGGDRRQVETVVERLQASFVELDGVPTVHCPVVEQVRDRYRELHTIPETTTPPNVRVYGGAWGEAYVVSRDAAAAASLELAIGGIDFPRIIEQAYADGVRIFLEMGPGGSCSRMIGKILEGRPHLARTASSKGQSETETVLRMAGALVSERLPVKLETLYREPELTIEPRQPRDRGEVVSVGLGPSEATLQALDRPVVEAGPSAAGPRATGPAAVPVRLEAPAAGPAPAAARHDPHPREEICVTSSITQEAVHPAPPVASAPPEVRPVTVLAPPAPVIPQASPLPGTIDAATVAGAFAAHAAQALSMARAQSLAHAEFLSWAARTTDSHARHIAFQTALARAAEGGADVTVTIPPAMLENLSIPSLTPARPAAPKAPVPIGPHGVPLGLDREQCLTFAIGKISDVLGQFYREVDSFPTRVRLPDEPLMLVDRIVSIDGEPGSMTRGTVVTEHDVLPGAWYLDLGRIPTCIAVEAGQADLFLSGFLGVDSETRGIACYRLLDAVVTFKRSLPGPGSTIRYVINIDRFQRQGGSIFFFFNFESTVDGEPLLTMRDGCAGFFTPEQLAEGRGIMLTSLDLAPMAGVKPADWKELVPMRPESYDEGRVDALRRGDLAACFGPEFEGLPLTDPLGLPGGRMRLVHRVVSLEPTGGRYGLGRIQAEADVHPDDWFLTCHFVDDMVMPGTLMYECCLHTLRILLMRMGWVAERSEVACEPVPGVSGQLKCRGQVLPSTRIVTYDVSIKELGFRPEPYAIADALMFSDGHPIVLIKNMSLRLSGLTRERLEQIWSGRRTTGPLFDRSKILAFSVGKPSEAFGEPYRVFDSERTIARLPGPPYMFLDRIVGLETVRPFVLEPGGVAVAEYDVPPDAWYFASNRQRSMPFAVILEIALQPCGWLAAYVGSALRGEIDLSFRNLGGTATLVREIFPDAGTLTTRVKLTRVSESGGMILQNYDMEMTNRGQVVYSGITSFGFFSKQALADQVGVRGAAPYVPSRDERARSIEPRLFVPAGLELPDTQLAMFDGIDRFIPDGGPHGLGYVRAIKRVDPSEWFFAAHFYQDPVWPGSLGLEAFLQLLKVAARERWGDLPGRWRFEPVGVGLEHTWVYRGQVVPRNRNVRIEAVVTRFDDERRVVTGDGYLSVDGIAIYQMIGFTIRIVPEDR